MRRHSPNGRSSGDILGHHRASPDNSAITHHTPWQYDRPGADQRSGTDTHASAEGSQGSDVAKSPDSAIMVHHCAVVNNHPFSHTGTWRHNCVRGDKCACAYFGLLRNNRSEMHNSERFSAIQYTRPPVALACTIGPDRHVEPMVLVTHPIDRNSDEASRQSTSLKRRRIVGHFDSNVLNTRA